MGKSEMMENKAMEAARLVIEFALISAARAFQKLPLTGGSLFSLIGFAFISFCLSFIFSEWIAGLNMDHALIAKAFGAFFAIMNPFVNLPIFLSLTSEYSIKDQRVLTTKIAIFSFIVFVIILIAGQDIINFFGITVNEFRIAGGVVLAHIAWDMLNGSESKIPPRQQK